MYGTPCAGMSESVAHRGTLKGYHRQETAHQWKALGPRRIQRHFNRKINIASNEKIKSRDRLRMYYIFKVFFTTPLVSLRGLGL